ncbi:MAG TPA: bifunctional pyr operon transcriptional regulator/uracil phosphoribosyltransferase PyrR [Polyangiaceae bacterium]|jgi:pyrimidine operon attenuation protein/uracil phosphoribosyltransferase|nr:bifunctional pyr operon transcriptional regulator/uracil phosphoribosyltransferase PyrR [Polyangiaceae bacterium]
MRTLLDPDSVARGLRRMAGEIVERHAGAPDLVLVAVRRGGIAVARELARWLKELEGHEPPLGSVDITLYRDDASTALPNPRIGPSEIPASLDGKHVILVDDVLYTGRTVRAAIDAVMDYGRPRLIELAVVVDRNGRELPIQANYFLRAENVRTDERVDVFESAAGLSALIQSKSAPTIPPSAPEGSRS